LCSALKSSEQEEDWEDYDHQDDGRETDDQAVLANLPLFWVSIVYPHHEYDEPDDQDEERKDVKDIP